MSLPYEIRPSLAAGFARSAAESAYPNLWLKLSLACVPALGITGITLPDYSGKRGQGDLAAGSVPPVWGSDRGPCLITSGGVAGVETTNLGISDQIIGTKNVTIIAHQEKRDATNRASALFSTDALGNASTQCAMYLPYSDGTIYWDFGGNGAGNRLTASGLDVSGDNVWAVNAGDLGRYIWKNGAIVASTTTATSRSLFGNATGCRIFQGPNSGGGGSDSVKFRELLVYNRNLSDSEIQLLSRNPLAPFVLKSRERLPKPPFSGVVDVIQSIGFVQTADYEALPVEVDCSNGFSFQIDIEHNQQYETVSNTFNFTSLVGQDVFEYIVQYLNFTPRTIEYASNFLDFNSFAGPVESETASNAFSFTQDAYQLFPISNVFSFNQSAVGSFIHDVSNRFELAGSADTNDTEYERDGVQHCVKQHVSFSISGDACREKNFAPMIGDSEDDSGDYAEMPTVPPTLTPSTMVLTYPFESPTTTMVFKNPGFGNDFNMEFTVLNRNTRGGDRVVFGDPKWAKSEVQTLKVDHVCNPDIEDYINFVNESLGKEIGLLDWEGQQWRGIIIAPQSDISKQVTGYSVQIVFRGELDE